jgi:hypothetical protein
MNRSKSRQCVSTSLRPCPVTVITICRPDSISPRWCLASRPQLPQPKPARQRCPLHGPEKPARRGLLVIADSFDQTRRLVASGSRLLGEAGLPMRIAVATVSVAEPDVLTPEVRTSCLESPHSGVPHRLAGRRVLLITTPVRRDIPGVANGMTCTSGAPQLVDHFEGGRLLTLDPVGIDRVDERDGYSWASLRASSRQSSKLPSTCYDLGTVHDRLGQLAVAIRPAGNSTMVESPPLPRTPRPTRRCCRSRRTPRPGHPVPAATLSATVMPRSLNEPSDSSLDLDPCLATQRSPTASRLQPAAYSFTESDHGSLSDSGSQSR